MVLVPHLDRKQWFLMKPPGSVQPMYVCSKCTKNKACDIVVGRCSIAASKYSRTSNGATNASAGK